MVIHLGLFNMRKACMKKKYCLYLIIAAIMIASLFASFVILSRINRTPWWEYLEYSPPLLVVPELDAVTMEYNRTEEISHVGYVIFMTIVNDSEYWIQRMFPGSFYHGPSTTMLEFFDGKSWRLVPANHVYSFVPARESLPIPTQEHEEKSFLIEYYFGLLEPGLYRIRTRYIIDADFSLFELSIVEEQEAMRNLSRARGPHDVVAEFYWSGTQAQ